MQVCRRGRLWAVAGGRDVARRGGLPDGSTGAGPRAHAGAALTPIPSRCRLLLGAGQCIFGELPECCEVPQTNLGKSVPYMRSMRTSRRVDGVFVIAVRRHNVRKHCTRKHRGPVLAEWRAARQQNQGRFHPEPAVVQAGRLAPAADHQHVDGCVRARCSRAPLPSGALRAIVMHPIAFARVAAGTFSIESEPKVLLANRLLKFPIMGDRSVELRSFLNLSSRAGAST